MCDLVNLSLFYLFLLSYESSGGFTGEKINKSVPDKGCFEHKEGTIILGPFNSDFFFLQIINLSIFLF